MNRHNIQTWQELIRRSTEDIEWFWPAALEDLGVEWFHSYSKLYDDSRGMPWTQWFLDGKINITHNCLDRHILAGKGNKVALLWEGDDGSSKRVTCDELYRNVNELATAMKHAGIREGDAVAMCMSISIETVIVMFAAMKIGAVCMQIAARSAPQEVVELLGKGKTKIFFVNDNYLRGGKRFTMEHTIQAALNGVPTLTKVVAVQRFATDPDKEWSKLKAIGDPFVDWETFVKSCPMTDTPQTMELDAEHPSLILFSSGTTGKSKAIVHTHGGALAQVVKEIGYAFDCHEEDVFYWFTNIGWMMAPWEIIGALFFGAPVVLYEGTHLYPTPHRLFELIEKYGITIAGFTPTGMRSLAKLDEDFSGHDLSSLRILGSTGEPLDPETWLWYFQTFGQGRCPIMNISGGTELIGCLLSPLPVMPQKPGTLGGPGLGMDVDTVDEEGNPVRDIGGYLICKKPFPSMTRGFLGEPERFLQTYFSRGLNVWVHGDRAEIDKDGLWYILGRADDLIVSGGVKHDPAKIEAALMSFPGTPRVKEAAAIGTRDTLKGHRVIGFVVIEEDNQEFSVVDFTAKLTAHVGKVYDPMGRPEKIHIVSALPKNLAAKIPRVLIRRAYEGEELGDLSKIDNPQTLEKVVQLGRGSIR